MDYVPPSTEQWFQTALFRGGYETVEMQLTLHFTGTSDDVPVGVVLRDPASGEWISAEVPSVRLDVSRPWLAVVSLHQLLETVQRLLSPF